MIASTHLAVFMLLLLSTSPAATGNDPEQSESVRWVRSLLKNDLEEIARTTHLPFQFRTTSSNKRCEGWIRTKRALRTWMACVNARKDMRELDSLIRTPGPLAVVGAGPVQPFDDSLKAHHLALKIGGLKGWPRWYGVAGTILWQTYEILLLAQSEHGRFTVKAMILDFRQSH